MSALLSKIHAVRQLALTIKKTGKIGGGINALFASYPDVWSKLQPELDRQGLSVGFTGATLEPLGDGEKVGMLMTISDGESVSESRFEMMVPERIISRGGSAVTNNAQRVANAQSYLKRTALIHAFGMSAGNEDECERMNPTGDQSNIPGLIRVNEKTAWQDLTDGAWSNAESPLFDGTLSGYSGERGKMIALWTDWPHHAGIIAWAADWITSSLQELGLSWADVTAENPALPADMMACDGAAMRTAANTTLQLRRLHKAGGQGA